MKPYIIYIFRLMNFFHQWDLQNRVLTLIFIFEFFWCGVTRKESLMEYIFLRIINKQLLLRTLFFRGLVRFVSFKLKYDIIFLSGKRTKRWKKYISFTIWFCIFIQHHSNASYFTQNVPLMEFIWKVWYSEYSSHFCTLCE